MSGPGPVHSYRRPSLRVRGHSLSLTHNVIKGRKAGQCTTSREGRRARSLVTSTSTDTENKRELDQNPDRQCGKNMYEPNEYVIESCCPAMPFAVLKTLIPGWSVSKSKYREILKKCLVHYKLRTLNNMKNIQSMANQ